MSNYLIIAAAVSIAIGLMHYLKLIGHCKLVLSTAEAAKTIDQNVHLSELEKEQQTQQVGKQLLGLFAKVFIGSVLAFGSPLIGLYILAHLQWIDMTAMINILSSWPFIVVFSLVVIVLWVKTERG